MQSCQHSIKVQTWRTLTLMMMLLVGFHCLIDTPKVISTPSYIVFLLDHISSMTVMAALIIHCTLADSVLGKTKAHMMRSWKYSMLAAADKHYRILSILQFVCWFQITTHACSRVSRVSHFILSIHGSCNSYRNMACPFHGTITLWPGSSQPPFILLGNYCNNNKLLNIFYFQTRLCVTVTYYCFQK